MKKLIITANPSLGSFTHKIANRLKFLSTEKGHKVEILDLYNTPLKQDFLTYEDREKIWKDPITKKIQKKIKDADELVFIFPIWWADMPAILKNFWDCNFTVWFAYKYAEWWKKEALLTEKACRVICTAWSWAMVYKTIVPLSMIWKNTRVWFCGMTMKSFTIFGDMDRSGTDRDKYLEKIDKLV